jgi:GT2 family glycosyltransferase
MKKGFISIIVVNWNGLKWLQGCFESLKKQTYKKFEIILVEDESTNQKETVAFVKKRYPEVTIVVNKHHLGFAGGNNLGFRKAQGEYILLLNNDTVHEPDFLEQFIKAFKLYRKAGAIQSKLVLMGDHTKLDVCGAFWTDSSVLNYIGLGKDSRLSKFNKPMKVFTNKGASMMIRRSVIDAIGLFDDDFWTYYEETDLCNRIWLYGYECWYYPKAVCYHANGGTSVLTDNSFIMFHSFKNKLVSFIKNFELKNLITIIPAYLFFGSLLCFAWVLQGKLKHAASWFKSLYWNIEHLSQTLKKRSQVQSLRHVSDSEIFKQVRKNPKLKYYYYMFFGLERYEV